MRIFMVQDLVWHGGSRAKTSLDAIQVPFGRRNSSRQPNSLPRRTGTIDFVTTPEDPQYAWYVEQHGRGCMILVAPFGSLFLGDPQDQEDLDFVSRAESSSG
jgi:hypothetical protein